MSPYGVLLDFYGIKWAKLLTAEASDAILGVDPDLFVFSYAYCVHGARSCALTAFSAYRSVYYGLWLEYFKQLFVTEQMYVVKTVRQRKIIYHTAFNALTHGLDSFIDGLSALL